GRRTCGKEIWSGKGIPIDRGHARAAQEPDYLGRGHEGSAWMRRTLASAFGRGRGWPEEVQGARGHPSREADQRGRSVSGFCAGRGPAHVIFGKFIIRFSLAL